MSFRQWLEDGYDRRAAIEHAVTKFAIELLIVDEVLRGRVSGVHKDQKGVWCGVTLMLETLGADFRVSNAGEHFNVELIR